MKTNHSIQASGSEDATPHQPNQRLTLRLDELAAALGVSRRSLERERSAGRFPRADLTIGRMPLWMVETIRDWIEKGGKGVSR